MKPNSILRLEADVVIQELLDEDGGHALILHFGTSPAGGKVTFFEGGELVEALLRRVEQPTSLGLVLEGLAEEFDLEALEDPDELDRLVGSLLAWDVLREVEP